jgi:hypothetical protein
VAPHPDDVAVLVHRPDRPPDGHAAVFSQLPSLAAANMNSSVSWTGPALGAIVSVDPNRSGASIRTHTAWWYEPPLRYCTTATSDRSHRASWSVRVSC